MDRIARSAIGRSQEGLAKSLLSLNETPHFGASTGASWNAGTLDWSILRNNALEVEIGTLANKTLRVISRVCLDVHSGIRISMVIPGSAPGLTMTTKAQLDPLTATSSSTATLTPAPLLDEPSYLQCNTTESPIDKSQLPPRRPTRSRSRRTPSDQCYPVKQDHRVATDAFEVERALFNPMSSFPPLLPKKHAWTSPSRTNAPDATARRTTTARAQAASSSPKNKIRVKSRQDLTNALSPQVDAFGKRVEAFRAEGERRKEVVGGSGTSKYSNQAKESLSCRHIKKEEMRTVTAKENRTRAQDDLRRVAQMSDVRALVARGPGSKRELGPSAKESPRRRRNMKNGAVTNTTPAGSDALEDLKKFGADEGDRQAILFERDIYDGLRIHDLEERVRKDEQAFVLREEGQCTQEEVSSLAYDLRSRCTDGNERSIGNGAGFGPESYRSILVPFPVQVMVMKKGTWNKIRYRV
ncbi:hypothetical protein BKA70DRAFT_1536704 [Coprinopsis sp. MPI-PUGE-AT-0042]|nr:hypothetical protein BKA70DRAFT_1536704 [Coprinopsis sp. MPI-PUGE-AT-0042]